MAQLPNDGFDPSTAPPSQDFELLPEGSYVATVTRDDVRHTKARTGQYLELEFTIVEGPAQRRKLWTRFNILNPSPKAVARANRDLAALCDAVGIHHKIKDSDELMGKTCRVHVAIEPAEGAYSASNKIDKFETLAGSSLAPAAPAAPAPAPAPVVAAPMVAALQAAKGSAAPWAQ